MLFHHQKQVLAIILISSVFGILTNNIQKLNAKGLHDLQAFFCTEISALQFSYADASMSYAHALAITAI
ncbi:hypothetical protein AMD27_17410 (plasmid) [Acinetobacter sp. TGL-Y2]|nr:hypothetical protein AMD27_17410 [Acinetobacter sp. TGL-Y2]